MQEGLTLIVVFNSGEEKLKRCLSSAHVAVDEIVAVDTGATDESRGVAETFDARLYDLEWPDAFDVAYNFAISKAKTDWILWLDSDEWLLPESAFMLQEVMYNPHLQNAFVLNLIRQDLWDIAGNFSEMYQTRMWRRHPAMRLQGAIHAHFPDQALKKASQGRQMLDTQIRFRHDGFLGGVSKEKVRRNLPYLEKELEQRPGQLYFEICIAESLVLLEDPKGIPMVEELLAKILDDPKPELLPRQAVLIFGLYLEQVIPSSPNAERVDQITDFVMRQFDTNIPILWTLHQYYHAKGNLALAYEFLKRMDFIHSSGRGDRFASYRPSIVQEGLWINLSTLAENFGETKVAESCYVRLLNHYRENQESQEFQYALQKLQQLRDS